jgi:hypothetical protein
VRVHGHYVHQRVVHLHIGMSLTKQGDHYCYL